MEKTYFAKGLDNKHYVVNLEESEGERLVLMSTQDALDQGMALVDGDLVDMRTRPSEFCAYANGGWVVDMSAVRARRNYLLAQSDWTQLSDVPQSVRASWAPYRQALRDVPAQPSMTNIAWPEPPA